MRKSSLLENGGTDGQTEMNEKKMRDRQMDGWTLDRYAERDQCTVPRQGIFSKPSGNKNL